MYAQEYSFYRRPDTSNVTWFTPQQLEAARVALTLAPVKVREIPPKIRSSPDENVDTQGLLAAAPALIAKALRKGLAVVHKEMPMSTIPIKGFRKFTLKHRRKLSEATKQQNAHKHQPSTH